MIYENNFDEKQGNKIPGDHFLTTWKWAEKTDILSRREALMLLVSKGPTGTTKYSVCTWRSTQYGNGDHANRKRDIAWKWIKYYNRISSKKEHFTVFSIPGCCAVQGESDCSCPFSLRLKAVCHLDSHIIGFWGIFDQKQQNWLSFKSFLPAVHQHETLSNLHHIPKNWSLKQYQVHVKSVLRWAFL